ncbi:hypothetical protein ABBQ38_010704 [Trebouxia sp. C0009 RCD-2024]
MAGWLFVVAVWAMTKQIWRASAVFLERSGLGCKRIQGIDIGAANAADGLFCINYGLLKAPL